MKMPCCNHKVDCGVPGNLDFDSPFENLTNEDPDVFTYASINYGWDWNVPHLGGIWQSRFCVGFAESAISQEDADLAAARLQYLLCNDNLPNGDDGGGVPCCRPPTTDPYPIYYSQQVIASAQCPDGTFFNYTVPAGMFVSSSQTLANRMAATYALRVARQARICLGDFKSNSCCVDTGFTTFMTPVGGAPPLSPQIVSGSLPPGLNLSVGADLKTVIISGIPTLTGEYDFILLVSDSLGRYMQKAYTITVGGIDNPTALPDATEGAAYAETLTASQMGPALIWTVAAGSSLPAGLDLNPVSGAIYGTPSTPGDYIFKIEVENYA